MTAPTIAWTASFPWECAIWDAPLIRRDELIVRAGPRVVGLSPADGTERWQVHLPAANLGGELLLDGGDLVVCDVTIDRQQHLVAADRSGVRWLRKLTGTVSRGGALVRGDAIEAVMTVRNGVAQRLRVDLPSGRSTSTPLPARGAILLPHRGELLVLSPTAVDGAPGAYRLGSDGQPTAIYRTGDVWMGEVVEDQLVTVGTRNGDAYVLEVCDLGDGTVRWGADCRNGVAAVEGDQVFHAIATTGGRFALVARARADGREHWRADLGDDEPAAVIAGGGWVVVRGMVSASVVGRGGQVYEAPTLEGLAGAVGPDHLYVGGERSLIAFAL
jgi:outer membrane protein assembly factor BamB